MAIKKIITADVLKCLGNQVEETVRFSEYMKDADISIYSVVHRRFAELFPRNENYSIQKISIEIVDLNETTGNETVLTRFFV